jgi:hypothetical protein
MTTATKPKKRNRRPLPTSIDPTHIYSHAGFVNGTGLCEQKLCELRALGVECTKHKVGRRNFYRGSDIIEFLQRAAEVERSRREQRAAAAE